MVGWFAFSCVASHSRALGWLFWCAGAGFAERYARGRVRVCGGRFCGAVWCGQDMGAVCGVAFWRLVWCDGCMQRCIPVDVLDALNDSLEAMVDSVEVPGLPGVTEKELDEVRAGLVRWMERGKDFACPDEVL